MTLFKDRLKAELERKGWSQRQLARAAGLTESAISHYMSGERTPRIDTTGAIAQALDVPLSALVPQATKDSDLDDAVALVLASASELSREQKQLLLLALADCF